jgi:hypothetical protein
MAFTFIIRMCWQFHAVTALCFVHACHATEEFLRSPYCPQCLNCPSIFYDWDNKDIRD